MWVQCEFRCLIHQILRDLGEQKMLILQIIHSHTLIKTYNTYNTQHMHIHKNFSFMEISCNIKQVLCLPLTDSKDMEPNIFKIFILFIKSTSECSRRASLWACFIICDKHYVKAQTQKFGHVPVITRQKESSNLIP